MTLLDELQEAATSLSKEIFAGSLAHDLNASEDDPYIKEASDLIANCLLRTYQRGFTEAMDLTFPQNERREKHNV